MAAQSDHDHSADSAVPLRVAVVEVAELAGLLDRMAACLEAAGVPAGQRNRCLLASEEIVVNALRHGREDAREEVVVQLATAGGEIAVTVSHLGIDFDPSDPRSIPPMDVQRVGGNGLRLVHQMADSIRYAHHDGRSTVVLIQRIFISCVGTSGGNAK